MSIISSTDIRILHREAMRLTDLAFEARYEQNEIAAIQYFQQALNFETRAADIVANDFQNEPTRSVLHRSAATLALDVGNVREAERLAARGLIGNPPEEIANELREVLDQSRFDRHLQLQGVTLSKDEFQFVIDGPAVAHGMTLIDVFADRIRDVERMVVRTAQRILKQDFAERAKISIPVYISTPRPASFAVSVKIGTPDQMVLPGWERLLGGEEVVEELLSCVELVNSGNTEALRSRFISTDPVYFQNFMALSQKIAPDGKEVNLIGFTSLQGSKERHVPFTRQRSSIIIPPSSNITNREIEGTTDSIVGRLRFADELSTNNTIKLVQEYKRPVTITVPNGMMTDYVGPLWGKPVRAFVMRYSSKDIVLRSIEEVTEDTLLVQAERNRKRKKPSGNGENSPRLL